jgi:hypothetical protein
VRRLAEFNSDGRRSARRKREAVERFKAGEAVMGTFGVDRATIYRLAEASA